VWGSEFTNLEVKIGENAPFFLLSLVKLFVFLEAAVGESSLEKVQSQGTYI